MEGVGFRAFRVEGLGEGRGGVRTLNLKSLGIWVFEKSIPSGGEKHPKPETLEA